MLRKESQTRTSLRPSRSRSAIATCAICGRSSPRGGLPIARDVKSELVAPPPDSRAVVGVADSGSLDDPGIRRSRNSQANAISTMTTSRDRSDGCFESCFHGRGQAGTHEQHRHPRRDNHRPLASRASSTDGDFISHASNMCTYSDAAGPPNAISAAQTIAIDGHGDHNSGRHSTSEERQPATTRRPRRKSLSIESGRDR